GLTVGAVIDHAYKAHLVFLDLRGCLLDSEFFASRLQYTVEECSYLCRSEHRGMRAGATLRQIFLHFYQITWLQKRMVAKQDFKSPQLLCFLDALDERPSPLGAHMDSQSTGDESPIRLIAVAGLKFDRRGSRGMTGSQVELKCHVADSHRLTFLKQQ